MKTHLIKETTVAEYAKQYAASRSSFALWIAALKYADWAEPADIQDTFPSADLLGNGSNRVVFDIGGNKFRLICRYYFGEKENHLYVKWTGTHAEYTQLCKKNDQYTVNAYYRALWKP